MYWNADGKTPIVEPLAININMRCIEIYGFATGPRARFLININMRCIEIKMNVL